MDFQEPQDLLNAKKHTMGASEVILPSSVTLDNFTEDVRRIHCAATNYTCQRHADIEYLTQNFKYVLEFA